ncbi:hypothetical protein JCM10296v2_003293 [Rhodotorula toruloides]
MTAFARSETVKAVPKPAARSDRTPTRFFSNDFGGSYSPAPAEAVNNSSLRFPDGGQPVENVAAPGDCEQQPLASTAASHRPRRIRSTSIEEISTGTEVEQQPLAPSGSAPSVRLEPQNAPANAGTTHMTTGELVRTRIPPAEQLPRETASASSAANSATNSSSSGSSSGTGHGAKEPEDVVMAAAETVASTASSSSAATANSAHSSAFVSAAAPSAAPPAAQAAQAAPAVAPPVAPTAAANLAPPPRPVINISQRMRELARAQKAEKAWERSLLEEETSRTNASVQPQQSARTESTAAAATASRPSTSGSVVLPSFQRIGSSSSRPQVSTSRAVGSQGNVGQGSPAASSSASTATGVAPAASTSSTTPSATTATQAGDGPSASSTRRKKKPTEFLVLFRSSKANERSMVRDGNIPKDHPQRAELVEALRTSARINVQAALAAYARDGKDGADAIFYLDGTEVFTPYMAFGHATNSPLSWSLQGTELPKESSGKAFLRRLPKARRIVLIGIDALTVDVEALEDTFSSNTRDDCEIVVTRGAGSVEPLNMDGRDLKRGVDQHLAGKSMKDVHPDVKVWFEGMKVGVERRTGVSLAQSRHGGEFRRSGQDVVNGGAGRRTSRKRARNDDDDDDDDDEDEDLIPPLDWHKHWRCGRNGCLFVGLWHEVVTHRKGASRVKCYGKCPLDCVLDEGGAEGMRNHLLTEHEGERRVCKYDVRMRPDGSDGRNRSVTLERASTRPVYPELHSSPWIDRSTAQSRADLAFDPFADEEMDEDEE